jgi:hypothetical protein
LVATAASEISRRLAPETLRTSDHRLQRLRDGRGGSYDFLPCVRRAGAEERAGSAILSVVPRVVVPPISPECILPSCRGARPREQVGHVVWIRAKRGGRLRGDCGESQMLP